MSTEHTLYDVNDALYTLDGTDRWQCWRFTRKPPEPGIYEFHNLVTKEKLQGTAEMLPEFQFTGEHYAPKDYERPTVETCSIPECTCEAFAQNYPQLEGAGMLKALHGMSPPRIEPFQFCPWCGQFLTFTEQITYHNYVPLDRLEEALEKEP